MFSASLADTSSQPYGASSCHLEKGAVLVAFEYHAICLPTVRLEVSCQQASGLDKVIVESVVGKSKFDNRLI